MRTDQIDHDLDQTDQISHDLDHIDYLACRYEILCRICTAAQIQRWKPVLNQADYAASVRHHELDHTNQESICPEISR